MHVFGTVSLIVVLGSFLRTQASQTTCEVVLTCLAQEVETALVDLEAKYQDFNLLADPVDTAMGKIQSAATSLEITKTILPPVATSLTAASKLPKVGALFKVPAALAKGAKTPVGNAHTAAATADERVATPWVTSAGRVRSVLDLLLVRLKTFVEVLTMTDFEEAVQDGLVNFLNGKCTANTLGVLAPAAKTAVSTAELTLSTLLTGLESVQIALNTAVSILESKDVQNTLKAINQFFSGINPVVTAVNGLQPISELLETQVSIPWFNVKDKGSKGVADECPEGYFHAPTGCLSNCPHGYTSDFISTCYSTCPKGYRDIGLLCLNRFYHVRDIKAPTVKCGFKKGCRKKCGSGYESVNYATCWEKCELGWKSKSFFGFGVCYKSCPNGMSLDTSKKSCAKKKKRHDIKGFSCPNGSTNIGGVCLEKCGSGEEDIGLQCVSLTRKRFKISTIVDQLSTLDGVLKQLPLYDTIENGIDSAVREALSEILGFLNLPSIDTIPTNLQVSLDGFPDLDGLDELVSFIEIPDLLESMDFETIISQQMDSILKSFGLSEELLDASKLAECPKNSECLAQIVSGIDQNVKAPSLEVLNSILEKLEAAMANDQVAVELEKVLDLFDVEPVCKSTTDVNFDVARFFAEKLGENLPPTTCSLDFTLCDEFELDGAGIQAALSNMATLLSPMVDEVAGLLDSDRRVLFALRSSSQESLTGSSQGRTMDQNNFMLPLGFFPLWPTFLVEGNLHSQRVGFSFFRGKFGKKDFRGDLGHTSLESPYAIFQIGKSNGKTVMSLTFRLRLNLFRFMHSALTFGETVTLALKELDELLEMLATDPINGVPMCFKDIAVPECEVFKVFVYQIQNRDKWKWENLPPGDPGFRKFMDVYTAYDHKDPWWDTQKGRETAQEMVDWVMYLLVSVRKNLAKTTRSLYTNGLTPKKAVGKSSVFLSYSLKRLLLSPVLVSANQASRFAPFLGFKLASRSNYDVGAEAWVSLSEQESFLQRVRLHLPMPQSSVLHSLKNYALDSILMVGVAIKAFQVQV